MKKFQMSQAQLKVLYKASEPVPMIALQCGEPRSRQENINDAWEALGKEMGFLHMTVRPISGLGHLHFEAEENE